MPDATDDPVGQFAVMLKRLITVARFYVSRDEGTHAWIDSESLVGLHVLTERIFYEADRAYFDAFMHVGLDDLKLRDATPSVEEARASVSHPHKLGLAMYQVALGQARDRWRASRSWFKEVKENGRVWNGWIYPLDFPGGPRYSILPAEMNMLLGALDLIGLPDLDQPRGARERIEPPTERQIADDLDSRKEFTTAKFIRFFEDKSEATHIEIGRNVLDDYEPTEETIRKRASLATIAMRGRDSRIRYRSEGATRVIKWLADA
jgi:hypothetical protein